MASPAQLMRPLCCWRSVLHNGSSQRTVSQLLAARVRSAPMSTTSIEAPKVHELKKIKIFPPPPTPTKIWKTPLETLHEEQIKKLDPTGARTQLFSKKNRESVKVGDILLVRQKNGEPFAGVLMTIRRRGVETGIQLRNQLTRIGVEMWFKIYSPNVEGIEVVQRKEKRARRARLTYLRKPKHDIGSVEGLVLAYQRQMAALRSDSASRYLQSGSRGRGKKSKKGRK